MKCSRSVFCLLFFHAALSLEHIRWCTVSKQELSKCNDMSKAFGRAGILPPLECTEGGSAANCIQMIKGPIMEIPLYTDEMSLRPNQTSQYQSTREDKATIRDHLADAVTLDGRLIYQAGKEHGLKPVVGEVYDQEIGTSYYAVAVVRKSSNITINSLKGVRSCHTGINRTAGWEVPVGYLIESGRLAAMGCDLPTAVSDYFSASCVPGANGANYPTSLCQLCKGDLTGQNKCEQNSQEQYYNYSGAFRCLAEGAGEVAFVKHSTVPENTDGRCLSSWAQRLRSQDFQLLCRNGNTADVTEWRTCHLARVPARAVVVRPDTDETVIFHLLNQGQQRFNGVGTQFQMFDSAAYDAQNLLFKDSTTELVAITDQNYQAWLGDDYLHAMQALNCDPNTLPESLNWCVVSTEEIWKCSEMAVAFKKKNLKPAIQCISANTKEECMELIQKKESDAVVLGGADIYTAGKIHGLIPAAGESYSGPAGKAVFKGNENYYPHIMGRGGSKYGRGSYTDDNSNAYYAVALVKRNLTNAFTISDLKGKKSCHTGLGRTAGWNIPIGILIKRGIIKIRDCNIPQAVSEFFSASCVPSAEQDNYPSKLCQLCVGDGSGNNKCSASSQERYYSYSGAFRCLAQDSGDVAFVKHSTVFENTDGKNTDSWAQNLKSTDFQLLCPNGARAEVTQFAECHLAQVPAQAIMVHPDTSVFALYGLLDKAQVYFGNSSNGNGFKMFDSSAFEGKNLIFMDSAVAIVPVGERRTYAEWLGSEYIESLEGMQTPQCSGASNIRQYLLMATLIPLLILCQTQCSD